MKSKMMSVDEPRRARSSYANSRSNAYRASNAQRATSSYSGRGRISPWLPIAVGAITVLVVARAVSQIDNRTTTERWLDRANRGWRDTRYSMDHYGSRAWDRVPDRGNMGDWLYDMIPTRRRISDLFARGGEWLPDAKTSKRQLLSSFDWSNPPRWLRNVDLSSPSKRRQFLRDMRRYGSRQGSNFLSSIGWR